MEKEDLLLDELDGAQGHVLAGELDVLQVLERREVMAGLPEEVRQEEGERDRAADPDPGFRELAALRRQKEREGHGGSKEQRRVLVLEAEAREDSKRDPPAR